MLLSDRITPASLLLQGTLGGMPLILAATPIGAVEDAPPRLRRLLAEADVIAAEDTRRVRDLARRLEVEIGGTVRSHHEHNEGETSAELVAEVAAGKTVLLVSDAGMPTVSDPGYRLVQEVIAAGLPVTAAPGPSAVLTALAISGLPTDRFCFEGFVPRKVGERTRFLERLTAEERTMIFFESTHRIHPTLTAMAQAFGGERAAAVCRELTKTYEEVRRGSLVELVEWAERGVRGEITVVVAGAVPRVESLAELVPRVLELVREGERFKTAVARVAEAAGQSKRQLYEAAQAARDSR